jgi:hypothetical protein
MNNESHNTDQTQVHQGQSRLAMKRTKEIKKNLASSEANAFAVDQKHCY